SLHFLRSSTPFPAGQIFSTPLNAKSLFTPPDDHSSFCSTVDGFQGSEADLIIVSLVRNNDKGSLRSALGFLVDERRMNVLLSRARYQLIIIGSYQFIKEWAGQIEKAPSFSGYQDGEFLAKLFSKLESYRQQEKLTLLPWTELSPSTQINQKKPNSNRKRNPIQVNKPNNLSARNNNGDKK
ncbi:MULTISPECIES: C-terminal helicase domain-containing protein, partial [unclassified Pseudomonas]|uniref:C-terminal helicase domain-containing protein n=1 Tax=unclassified Pseudomonas TaxID=196821 RepID=UPI0013282A62